MAKKRTKAKASGSKRTEKRPRSLSEADAERLAEIDALGVLVEDLRLDKLDKQTAALSSKNAYDEKRNELDKLCAGQREDAGGLTVRMEADGWKAVDLAEPLGEKMAAKIWGGGLKIVTSGAARTVGSLFACWLNEGRPLTELTGIGAGARDKIVEALVEWFEGNPSWVRPEGL